MADQSSNLTTFRNGRHVGGVRLSIYKGAVKASGSVTATPTFPATSIAVSYSVGAYTDAYRGMRVNIRTSGGELKGVTHVRFSGTISSSALPIRETGNAKISIVSGDTFELIDEPMLVGKLPTADETFSPDGLAYTDEGDTQRPVVQSGGHWAGRVARGASFAEVIMPGGGYVVDYDSSSAVTHSWGTLPSGVAYKSGSASTDAQPTLEVDPGFHVVPHAVTDPDNSKTATQRVILMCDDANYTYSYGVLEATVEGQEQGLGSAYSSASVTLAETVSVDDAPDGALAILWADEETIGGSANIYRNWNYTRSGILFVGYVKRDEGRNDIASGDSMALELISPLQRLAEMTSYSKALTEVTSPDAWGELDTGTVWRMMIYVIQNYTSIIEAGFDFTQMNPSFDLLYPEVFLQESTFYAQYVELTAGLRLRVVCDRTGRIWTQRHPVLIPLSDRASTTTTSTYTSADVYPGYTVARTQQEPVKYTRLKGFTAGAAQGVSTIYPSNAPGEGIESPSYERQIVESITDARAAVGMYGAYHDNACVDANGARRMAPALSVTMPGTYDHLDFGLTEYMAWNLSNPRDVDLTDFLFYLKRWRATYASGTCEVAAEFGAATYAPAGAIEDDVTEVVIINDPPVVQPPVTGTPTGPGGLYPGIRDLALFLTDNTMRLASNGNRSEAAGGPNWDSVDLTGVSGWPGGTVVDFVLDPFSPKLLGTGSAVNGWLVTTTHVMTLNAIGDSMTISDATSLTAASGTTGARNIQSSRAAEGVAIIVSYSTTHGTICHYTGDGGSTWSNSTVSGSVDANSVNNGNIWSGGLFLGMTNADLAYTSAFNTTTDADGYRSTNGGASWSAITGSSVTPDIEPNKFPANSVACPIFDSPSSRAVYGSRVSGSFLVVPTLYRAVGATTTNISPNFSSKAYGPYWLASVGAVHRAIAIADDDANTAVLCGAYSDGTNANSFRARVFVTRTLWQATPTWEAITGESTSFDWHGAYGVSANLFWLIGKDGNVGVLSYSGGAWTLDNRKGDLSTTGEVVGLCGV